MSEPRYLHQLDPREQKEVVEQRLRDTQLLRDLALERPYDQLVQSANDLDIMAKLSGVYIEYDEELGEDCPMW